MHLNSFTLYRSPLELKEPFVISLGPLTHANNLFLRATTNTGLVGWGEASPFPTIHGETMDGALAIGQWMARQLLGTDPREAAVYTAIMNRAITGNQCLKSAFDLACHDLAAQAAGVPLYAYLGGTRRENMRTDYTVSLGSVAAMVAKAAWIKEQGFPVIKIKLGAGPQDAERVFAISREVGPLIPLRLDANQGWSPEVAITLLRGWKDLNIEHCEAPIPRRDFLELPRIRAASPIPLMADEACWDGADAARLLSLGAVDRINIKLSKSGGLHEGQKILRIAERNKVPLQVGGFLESRLGFTAAAHFACSSPAVQFYDFDTPLMQQQDPVLGGITYGPGGRVSLPEGIGLGASLRPEYLETLTSVSI